ncbi:hypothetical protein LUZ60_001090 [Juncus effusus]|nr:hypothetical protein LUZ60_001090 [Juncus effusus]
MASSSSSSPATGSNSVISSATTLADSLFQRSLDDLIKSLRSDPASEPSAISRAIAEIRREIRSPEPLTKSIALQKLTYLSSLHFISMAWASFHTLELLPSPIPHIKRLAYLSASLSFHPSTTDLLPLSTHQLHKDLTSLSSNSSTSPSLPSLPLHFLSVSSSPDLALHLAPDLAPLLSRPSPLQPKAVASAYRVLSFCPTTVPILFKPLVDCLSSENPQTVSAAIGAFCELSSPPNDPTPYLPLAPEIHKILTNSKSNWILIKTLKIFSRLVPLEPRLGNRIVDPICQFLRQSQAKSLVLECVKTVLSCFPSHEEAVQLAIEKIKELLNSDDDPNLRYLGLQTLEMLGPNHNYAIESNREIVARSLTDPDRTIRKKALQLIVKTTSQSNSIETFSLLVKEAAKSDLEFANEILDSVLSVCGKDDYALVMDFDWYISLLGEMARVPNSTKGEEIGRQMIDIGIRVRDARQELIRVSRELLIDPSLYGNPFLACVLSACAWICGEFVEFLKDFVELLEALLQPRVNLLPSSVRVVFIQSIIKVLIFSFYSFVEGKISIDSVLRMVNLIEITLGPLVECDDVAVLERIRNLFGVIYLLRDIKDYKKDEEKDREIGEIANILKKILFSEKMGPVSINAQKRIPVPDGLELKENLADLAEFITSTSTGTDIFLNPKRENENENLREEMRIETKSSSILLEHRKRHGLYYLPTEKDEKEAELTEDFPLVKDDLITVNNEESSRRLKVLKPRPTVVKLEEETEDLLQASSSVSVVKTDNISGAIMSVLSGNKNESENRELNSSQERGKEREKNTDRERKKGSKKNEERRRKSRNRKEKEASVVSSASKQEPAIQDFLL